MVLTKVRDTEPGRTGQAEVLARGYMNGKLLATRRIGDGYGWNWFASGVCSLTITTGTGPPPVHVVRQVTAVMLYDPGLGCVSAITKSWPAQLAPASQPAPARPVTAYVVNVNGGSTETGQSIPGSRCRTMPYQIKAAALRSAAGRH